MGGLLQRGITAFIFVLIMLAGLFGGPIPFVILFSVITGLCLWEYLSMVLIRDHKRDRIRKLIGLIMGVLPVLVSAAVQLDVFRDQQTFVLFTALLFSPFIFMAFVYELFTKSEQPFANIAYIMLGIIYIGVPFALLHFIAFDAQGEFYARTVFGLLLADVASTIRALTWWAPRWASGH
jgi:phosphatidate cytidylyltransferase